MHGCATGATKSLGVMAQLTDGESCRDGPHVWNRDASRIGWKMSGRAYGVTSRPMLDLSMTRHSDSS